MRKMIIRFLNIPSAMGFREPFFTQWMDVIRRYELEG